MINQFKITSIHNDILNLKFVSGQKSIQRQINPSIDKADLILRENVSRTIGTLTIDLKTLFIRTMEGTVKKEIEAALKGESKHTGELFASFVLNNMIE